MTINPHNPFKGRQYPGEVIVLCVRWYLRYPLSYEHVTELVAERGVEVDASCIWRWVQAYAPELNKRCRPHLKPTNKSYRIDETLYPRQPKLRQAWRSPRTGSGSKVIDFLSRFSVRRRGDDRGRADRKGHRDRFSEVWPRRQRMK